jgi:hypothetical protein
MWSPDGRKREGRPYMKWEKEVPRVMKQKNLTPEEAAKWKMWRRITDYQ